MSGDDINPIHLIDEAMLGTIPAKHVLIALRSEFERLQDWHSEMFQYAADRDAEIERLLEFNRRLRDDMRALSDALAAERALADQLAEALSADPQQDMGIGRRAALAAHEEARRER